MPLINGVGLANDVATSLKVRKNALLDRFYAHNARLVVEASEFEPDAEKLAALEVERLEILAETKEIARIEVEARLAAARAKASLALSPAALINAAEGREPRTLIDLLAAFPEDAWAERIAAQASHYLSYSRSADYCWGPYWEAIVDDLKTFVEERGIGVAA